MRVIYKHKYFSSEHSHKNKHRYFAEKVVFKLIIQICFRSTIFPFLGENNNLTAEREKINTIMGLNGYPFITIKTVHLTQKHHRQVIGVS